MNLTGKLPETGPRRTLFRMPAEEVRRWEHLVIHGENIANILFDPLGDIETSGPGAKALDEALAEESEPEGEVTG